MFFMKWQFGSTSRKRRSSSSAWQGSEEMGSSQLHHAELLNPELLKDGEDSTAANVGTGEVQARYFVKQSSEGHRSEHHSVLRHL